MIPLLLDALSAYRLTRLITADTILDGPRDALVKWAFVRADVDPDTIVLPRDGAWAEMAMDYPAPPKLAAGILCRYCVGVWVGFGVMVARRRFPRQWAPIAEALALSAGAALIAGLED